MWLWADSPSLKRKRNPCRFILVDVDQGDLFLELIQQHRPLAIWRSPQAGRNHLLYRSARPKGNGDLKALGCSGQLRSQRGYAILWGVDAYAGLLDALLGDDKEPGSFPDGVFNPPANPLPKAARSHAQPAASPSPFPHPKVPQPLLRASPRAGATTGYSMRSGPGPTSRTRARTRPHGAPRSWIKPWSWRTRYRTLTKTPTWPAPPRASPGSAGTTPTLAGRDTTTITAPRGSASGRTSASRRRGRPCSSGTCSSASSTSSRAGRRSPSPSTWGYRPARSGEYWPGGWRSTAPRPS